MKLLVCGSRNMPECYYSVVKDRIQELGADVVIAGGAAGADTLAELAGKELGVDVQVFPADWSKHGKMAGILRNLQMLDEKPDMVLAFYPESGITRGTSHTVRIAKERGIPVMEVTYRE